MKKALKVVLWILLAILLAAAALVGWATIVEYRPEPTSTVPVSGKPTAEWRPGDTLTAVTWNLGYGALGDNATFFMDGGADVYTADKARVTANMDAILTEMDSLNADLFFLQEVDINSDRSYHINEQAMIAERHPDMASAAADNFRVMFVPYPIPPIGHVESGIQLLSRAPYLSAERISQPCPFSWPIRVANLKRCLLVTRIKLADTDRELVVIDLHMDAYDDGGGRIEQTKQLAAFMQAEYAKGNYVIAGGDFNQTPSNIDTTRYYVPGRVWEAPLIDVSLLGENVTFRTDDRTPTCRALNRVYAGADAETFEYYVIDGFVVSANIRIEACETQDLHFAASDHNPVKLQFTLLPENE